MDASGFVNLAILELYSIDGMTIITGQVYWSLNENALAKVNMSISSESIVLFSVYHRNI